MEYATQSIVAERIALKILVAEDDPVSLLILRKTLERLGHVVTCVHDGEQAWEALQQNDFEVLITDWMMPGLDGAELCHRLRAQITQNYTYAIMLTAKSQRQDRIDAFASGADDLLTKPMEPQELIARLEVASRIILMQGHLRQQSRELTQMTRVLENANSRVTELFQGLPIPCITISDEARIMEWNVSAEQLFSTEPHEAWLKPIWDIIVGPDHRDEAIELAWRALTYEKLGSIEWAYPQKNGAVRNLLLRTYPLRGPRAEIVGAAIACVDLTDRKRLEQQIEHQLLIANETNAELELKNNELEDISVQLQDLASSDGLTGLRNYRSFREHLHVEFEKARLEGTPLSIVLLDVDLFKNYNDTYGHPAGDEVLRSFSKIITESFGENALVARYGGEEFVAILPGRGSSEAVAAAERTRAMIEGFSWEVCPVTASFGVASLAELGAEHELVEMADLALYRSKGRGRNRVTHFDDDQRSAA